MAPITSVLEVLAKQTWQLLSLQPSTRLSIGEQSITDVNLLLLQDAVPDRIRVVKWSAPEEGSRSGADWDWWIATPRHFLRLRIQAKKLMVSEGRYHQLGYTTKKHGRQIDLLRASAKADGCIPFYCLYNAWSGIHIDSRCPGAGPQQERLGCALTPAAEVHKLIAASKNKALDAIPTAHPWQCLFSHEPVGASKGDLVERVAASIEAAWGIEVRQLVVQAPPPARVVAVLQGAEPEPNEVYDPEPSSDTPLSQEVLRAARPLRVLYFSEGIVSPRANVIRG